MLDSKDWSTVEAMDRFGGSFVQALAQAARKADGENLQRLKTAFPEYWERYQKIAEQRGI